MKLPDESSPLSIIVVSTHFGRVRGGAEINDRNLGIELSKLGNDVRYITIAGEQSTEDIEPDCYAIDCPYLYDRSYQVPGLLGKPLRHLNEEIFVHRTRQEATEILTESNLVLTTGRPILTRLRSSSNCILFHAVRGRVNPLYDRYLTAADGLVFWGGCEAEYDNEEVLSQPQVTLNPAVDTDLFFPRETIDSRVSYITDERIVLSFVGRLEKVKRIDRIIDAVAVLEEEFDLALVILGDGSQREALESRAEEMLTGTSTHFLGQVSQETVSLHLNAADLFVMASRMENHPIALKEALACGTYAVAPDIGRIGSIVTPDTGRVFENNTTEGLTAALRETIRTGEHRSLSRTERAAKFEGWEANAKAIIELYERLAQGRT